MSNFLPDKNPSKQIPEEHKMNALAKEFQATLNITPSVFPSIPYSNYYQNYNEFNYSYPTYYPPMMPYKFGGMPQQPMMDNYYPGEKQYNSKKSKKGLINNEKMDYTSYVAIENPQFDLSNVQYDEKLLQTARYFIIKSYNEENVIQAVRFNIWSSTPSHNEELNKVYLASIPVILFFSVNGSGHFYGVAQMSSEVMFDKYFEGWSQKDKWRGVFEINWFFIKDIPNKEFKEIRNPLNLNKPVHNSRDCQEIPGEEAVKVMKIFEKYQNASSILSKIKG